MKWVIGLLLLCIVFSLFRGMYFLVKDGGQSKRTVNSLTYRVGLSAMLLILLVVGTWQGWIEPHTVDGQRVVPANNEVTNDLEPSGVPSTAETAVTGGSDAVIEQDAN